MISQIDIIGLTKDSMDRVVSVFSLHPAVDEALVFGSRAKGTAKPGSDLDLAIRGNAITHQEFLNIDQDLDDLELPIVIDLCLTSQLDHQPLADHIARVGISIYRKS